jgi:TPR repeat protein
MRNPILIGFALFFTADGFVYSASGKFAIDEAAVASAETKTSAEGGDASAQFRLGLAYSRGEGVPKDIVEALKWYRRAAEGGHLDAQVKLGLAYARGEGVALDRSEAVKWYLQAAGEGDPNAQFCLGEAYYFGLGVPQNVEEAVRWWKEAASGGVWLALALLADVHARAHNWSVALDWYRKADHPILALRHGSVSGKRDALVTYNAYNAAHQDPIEAVRNYYDAARKHGFDAQFDLPVSDRNFGAGGTREFVIKAVKYFQDSAARDEAFEDGGAEFVLGSVYAYGIVAPRNLEQAFKWYHEGAKRGNLYAAYRLGLAYAYGRGVVQNPVEAAMWWRRAAAQRDAHNSFERVEAVRNAAFNLGLAYSAGEGVAKNALEAWRWYLQAAQDGHVGAQLNVGNAYATGEGVIKNEREADYWKFQMKQNRRVMAMAPAKAGSAVSAFNAAAVELGNVNGDITKEPLRAEAPRAAAANDGTAGGAATGEYVVKSGDTSATIARANNVSLSDLIAANPGVNWLQLKVGDTIKLPER